MTPKTGKGPWLAAVGVVVLVLGMVLHTHAIGAILRWIGVVFLCADAALRRKLTPWIFVAMVAGSEIGVDAPHFAMSLNVFSSIFLRLIKTIVAPLILGTLVVGIAGHGDLKKVGWMGVRALIYFEVATTLALGIGLIAINISKAGVGLGAGQPVETQAARPGAPATVTSFTFVEPPKTSWDDVLLHMFPENLAKSIAENQLLQVTIFAVFFGASLCLVSEEKRAPLLKLAESLSEVMFKFTNLVMYLAPLGVLGAMAFTVGHLGIGVLWNLGKVLLTLYAALISFALLVFLPSALLFRVPLRSFLKYVAEPATIAFATATSEAALPIAMEKMEAMGVPRRIVAFVIPTGYAFNLDGTSLYLAVASVFVAQAAGIHMTVGEQLFMMGTLVLTSKGVGGVARASLVVLLATAATFHLPEWPIAVLLGFDTLLDMGRTAINVTGNCLASAVIAMWQGEMGAEKPSEVVAEGAEM
ncbi:proton glutamate symport protein [Bryocella elongata]|uniref:Proton glutamate symport protein n=1 Tax=Bryocella elongata TaxID=863522 RepID=A0A1H6B1Z2_9BACT|nr:cation:dicarboxylase symporter family transporter [Bryocella elongata]SEG54624.1 proton glutamate symport protein [Bryocella elongata]